MTVADVAAERGIKEGLHFTTHFGLTGILDGREVKSRLRLRRDQRLAYILRLNSSRVLDEVWKDYVHLSISRINSNLYDVSSVTWHPDVWWAILSFDPEIISHEGVYFTTTNNAYHQHVKRGKGADALEALFAERVASRYGQIQWRTPGMPDHFTTCIQAEVMYPRSVSTCYLKRIYVGDGAAADDVCGLLRAVLHRPVEVVVDRSKFTDQVGLASV